MNEITYNNKNLSDFGVYYDSHSSFGSPERDVELVEIAGKNGALIIDNDRYRNIDLTFPCYVHTNFLAQYRSVMAYLQSCKGYNRLEITQEPNHFRMASFNMGSQPTPNQLHRSGQFPVVFNCKPQRFLKSGETPVPSASSQSVSYEGNPVSINNPSGLSTVSSLAVALNPVQDLHGYDSPWVGGAGSNILDPNIKFTAGTYYDTTLTTTDGYTCTRGGTATSSGNIATNNIATADAVILPAGTYSSVGAIFTLYKASGSFLANKQVGTWTTEESFYVKSCYVQVVNGTTYSNTFFIALAKGSTAPTSWSPYENICPIYPANGKNLLPKGTDRTSNGIKFTVQDDGSVVATNTATGTAFWASQFTIPAGTYTYNGCPSGGGASSYYLDIRNALAGTGIAGTGSDTGSGYTFTISEPLTAWLNIRISSGYACPTGGVVFKPMIRMASFADGTYAPYQGIVVERCGKNLIDESGLPKTVSGANYISFPLPTWAYLRGRSEDVTLSLKGSLGEGKTRFALYIYDTVNNNALYIDSSQYLTTENNFTLKGKITSSGNTTDTTKPLTIRIYAQPYDGTIKSTISGLMLAFGDTEYEPYTGISYPISLGQSVYGGTVDLATGVLTVTHGYVDLGSLSWTLQSLDRWKSNDLTNVLNPTDNYSKCGAISDRYVEYAITELNSDSRIGFSVYQSRFYLRNGSTSITPTGTVVYPLESPTTVQLTPQQISLLTGVNVISSSDEVTVTVTEPSLLVNPTLFESKPLIRVYGTGTITINNQYITISAHSFPYIDIDCELMDAYYEASNANAYVSFSTTDYVTLRAGNNYVAYTGGTLEITPRWYEV